MVDTGGWQIGGLALDKLVSAQAESGRSVRPMSYLRGGRHRRPHGEGRRGGTPARAGRPACGTGRQQGRQRGPPGRHLGVHGPGLHRSVAGLGPSRAGTAASWTRSWTSCPLADDGPLGAKPAVSGTSPSIRTTRATGGARRRLRERAPMSTTRAPPLGRPSRPGRGRRPGRGSWPGRRGRRIRPGRRGRTDLGSHRRAAQRGQIDSFQPPDRR